MKIAKFPIILLSIFVGTGIIIENTWHFSIHASLIFYICCLIILYIFHQIANQKIKYFYPFNVAFALSSITLGVITAYYGDTRNHSNHYTYYLQASKPQYFQIQIDKQLKSSPYYHSYIGEIIQVDHQSTEGKILLRQTANDSTFNIGSLIKIYCLSNAIQHIPAPKTPFDFDYAKYMARKQIYRQINLKNKAYEQSKYHQKSIITWANSWKNHVSKIFKEAKLSDEKLALAKALFLGERKYLSNETIQHFQAAGTIHILAISGLHIGILLLFLNFIFKFVKRYAGVKTFVMLTISILWFYAMMTGFSPSVTRAVTMFSFLQIGLQLKRKTSIYNSLFASALLMMLVNPNIIYEVGFQMSYAAVIAIISFLPILKKWFFVQNKIFNWLIELSLISVSAQLGVLPLSLYYFHQFPVYFFLANMLVVPMLFIVLFFGFAYIILALIGIVIPNSNLILNLLLGIILKINQYIASFNIALLTNIQFSLSLLIISFVLIRLIYLSLQKTEKTKYIFMLLSGIAILQSIILFEKYQKNSDNKYYIFHQYKNEVLGKSEGNSFIFYKKKNQIDGYLLKSISHNFATINYDSLNFVQYFNNKTILHIDSLGIYQFYKLKVDIVHISYNPKINFERMIKVLKPTTIVVDGSNYPGFIKRWKNSTLKAGINFHNTYEQNAFIMK